MFSTLALGLLLAAPAVITFEGFPDSTILTTQYPGLMFSNTIILTAGISLNEFEFPPDSGVNVASDFGGPISISFATPISSFGAYFTYTQPVTIVGFDAFNNPVVFASSQFSNNEAISGDPGSSPNEFIEVSYGNGLSMVTITGNPLGGSFVLDDATYNPIGASLGPSLGPAPISAVPVGPAYSTADAYQIGYAANLNIGDSVVNLSNSGAQGGFYSAGTTGNLCVNVYTFDPQEEEISCCSCLVTPDGLNSLSVTNDLINNTLTSGITTSVSIALVASVPGTNPGTKSFDQCNPGGIAPGGTPPAGTASGMLSWGTTLEPAANSGAFGVVPVSFRFGALSSSELSSLVTVCGFIQGTGSGFGVCNSCRTGALGGAKQ
jgi:hypothetical protein